MEVVCDNTHEISESDESSRKTRLWVDFYQDIAVGVNVDLKKAGSVQRAVE